METGPSYLLGVMTPRFLQSPLAFYFAWWLSFHPSMPNQLISLNIDIWKEQPFPLFNMGLVCSFRHWIIITSAGRVSYYLCVIVTCLCQAGGMPQQDKVLWKFRLLLLASRKGNYFSATRVELPVANTEILDRTKATGPLIPTTPEMQLSQTSTSNAKSWISYWRLDLVKLGLPKKPSFIILILLILTQPNPFPTEIPPNRVRRSPNLWITLMEEYAMSRHYRLWEEQNRTRYTITNHRIAPLNQRKGSYKAFVWNEGERGCQG